EGHRGGAQRVDERERVLAERVHVQPGADELALALPAVVVGDAAEAHAQGCNLRVPHPARVEETVGEEHRRFRTSGVVDRELDAVAADAGRHRALTYSSAVRRGCR